MKLRTRLIISFCTIVFVPVMLSAMVIIGLSNYQIKELESDYGVETLSIEVLSNPIHTLSKLTAGVYEEMLNTAEKSPEKFEDNSYLEEINHELREKYSYLIVVRDNEMYYKGTDDSVDSLVDKLCTLTFKKYDTDSDIGIYIGDEYQTLVRRIDFIESDGGTGNAYIITYVSNIIPQVRTLLIEFFVSMILILIFTSALFTIWIYSGIVRPIGKLTIAAKNIKEGNLDFTLEAENNDEIGELCYNFEDMRKRLKESAEEKVQHDKESKELISNISHDLKTPLTAIKGYVEGLMDGVASSPEMTEKYMKTIYNKASDMDKLIDELFFYSKIDTNKIPYTFTVINVDEYFKECLDTATLDLEAKNIELAYFNYADENIEIIADKEQLKRVINNIISNSAKYIDKKRGIVNVRIKDIGDFIQVEIEDNGKGIAEKDLPYIFDRFYRTDSSRNSKQGGSGIGLSIVKKIIEDHGGKIWATSKETTGTVMYFVLRKYQEETIYE